MQDRNRFMNMSSTIDRHTSLRLQMFSTQYAILFKSNQDDHGESYLALFFVVRLVLYVSILALLVIVVALIIKYLGDYGNDFIIDNTTTSETNHLLPKEAPISFSYGTCENEEDVEKEGKRKSSGNSSDELYDGKICIICYEEPRNCFFVPCGHCATCHVCAHRIMDEESRTCPVCRRLIRRVKRLFTIPQNQTDE
ncbi:E3 ubiquitin-protein ligase APD1 [Camellia lanceoleosa]|uniref:E3 ubiquitin-protein ligase APD1 n=1 Tax=Camellia lanceoleosa TaxID=1840588 RepID=A0ACC0I0P5_9ERIC|nr:E3 ubiquitin-protein ligase APD1 [Camellia lanceoleosa]